jgi:2-keto-myo-inositol isomerase
VRDLFPFKTALNASTLFPFNLDVKEQVRIAAEAGYEGIELWVKDLNAYLTGGGTLTDLRQYISDTGIALVNAIAFFAWSDADEVVREQAFKQAEIEMRMLAELGCAAVAAPPFGNVEQVSLDSMAANFSRLTNLANVVGIKPYLEFWGRAKTLSRFSEAMYVAMESGVSEAQILLDPFHMYTGGSSIDSIAYVQGKHIGIVHANDYPVIPERAFIADRDRVFPGEGSAPSQKLARLLYESGYRGYLSLELFIEDFGTKSALEVAKLGLESMKSNYQVNAD